jgi:hypothetical protein
MSSMLYNNMLNLLGRLRLRSSAGGRREEDAAELTMAVECQAGVGV